MNMNCAVGILMSSGMPADVVTYGPTTITTNSSKNEACKSANAMQVDFILCLHACWLVKEGHTEKLYPRPQ